MNGPGFLEINNGAVIGSGNLDVKPIAVKNNFKKIKNEGVWINKPLNLFPGKEVMGYTFVRPDPERSYAYVTLVQMDMNEIKMAAVAGTKQPGGPVGKPGPGVVPKDIINSSRLVAAFDGGFQYRDGQYGMIAGNTTYLPLKNDLGTLVGFIDGSLKIINYNGEKLGNEVEFVRQNCPILIENGELAVINPKNKKLWGRTLTSDIYTWRSGVGLNKEGNLIYAVGNNLTPTTLAYALKMAGAINAIQLDINPYWVRFNIFNYENITGKYKTTTLTNKLQDGSKQYLTGYTKDFFYLYKKN